MYCLWLFIVVLHCLLLTIVVCSMKSMCIPCFVLIGCCVGELHGHLYYVPIVMWGLRLFIVTRESVDSLYIYMARTRCCSMKSLTIIPHLFVLGCITGVSPVMHIQVCPSFVLKILSS